MPSFDIVSRTELPEVDNAVQGALREIGTRYDFKGSNCSIERADTVLTIRADDDFRLKQVQELLRGHLARANPQWKQLAEAGRALVVFQGPYSYVTPSWYETKKETGKVVPTWNYVIVQARGAVKIHEDAAWLRAHVGELSDAHEAGRADPWAVTDAPESFIDSQIKGIVGFEIEIAGLEGKW